jgi:hypothetical protein
MRHNNCSIPHKRLTCTPESFVPSPRPIINPNSIRQPRRPRRLNRPQRTLPLQRKRPLNQTLPGLLRGLPLPLLALIRPATPEIFPVNRHAVRNTPLPFVELDRLHGLDVAHQRLPLSLAGRAEFLEFPALVRVRDDIAVGRAVLAGLDQGVLAFDYGFGGEG